MLNRSGKGRRAATVLMALACISLPLLAADTGVSTSLTIYSSARPGAISPDLYRPLPGGRPLHQSVPGYAMVRQEREILLGGRRDSVRFTDVAARIDPTTVTFISLSAPDTRVLEQDYRFDLVDSEKLLQRYLDQVISVDRLLGDGIVTVQGRLLSTLGGLVLMDDKGEIQVIREYAAIRFPELPGGLVTRPTLIWEVAGRDAGRQRVRVSYQTGGMTWWADYNLIYHDGSSAGECHLDVGAWVSIINQSGATYEQAALKLVAGDLHRAEAQGLQRDVMRAYTASEPLQEGFVEKSFFEYHLYTLGRNITLADNSAKQLELFPVAHDVACRKNLVYEAFPASAYPARPLTDAGYGSRSGDKVQVYLQFMNRRQDGLGMPLPSGRVRVSKLDPQDQAMEFIGEDVIDHTPEEEPVKVHMGSAFDVNAERRQLQFSVDSKARWMSEEIEVTLKNHKEQEVEVLVKEHLYRWANWEITRSSHPYERADAATVHYPLKVPANGRITMNYTVRYRW